MRLFNYIYPLIHAQYYYSTFIMIKMKKYINILILCALNLGGIYNQSHSALNKQHHNTYAASENISH